MNNKKVSKKGMIISFIVFIISAVLFLGLMFLGFTTEALKSVMKVSTADSSFFGYVDPLKTVLQNLNGAKGSVFASFFITPKFDKSLSIMAYVSYGILALTLILIIVEICVFVKKNKNGMIWWIIPTLIAGLFGVEMCLVAEKYVGFVPGDILGNASGAGFKGILTLKLGVSDKTTLYKYAAVIYSLIIVILATIISGLATAIAPIVYAAKCDAQPKAIKAKDGMNEAGEFDPNGLQPNEFEENVNNLNTIGTTSPLVVQYINSYGEQNAQSATSAPKAANDEYLTKADVKDLLQEILATLKEEKENKIAEEQAPKIVIQEQPVVEETPAVPTCVCEPEPAIIPEPAVEETVEPAPVAPVVAAPEEEAEEEPTDVFANLIDEEGNQVEVIDADDLRDFIRSTVVEALEEQEKVVEEREAAIKEEETTINEPKETIGYEDEPEEVEEPVVKTEEPALNHTIVVAVPADYKEEPDVVEETPVDAVESIDEVRDIVAEEIRDAFKNIKIPAAKPQPKPAPAPVKAEPTPVPAPAPVIEEKPAPVIEEKPQPKPIVRNEVRGSEEVVERGEVIRLNFLEKVASGSKDLIKNYNAIKNLLMSFGLKDRLSNSADTFRLHKNTYAKITTNGDAIKLFLALDPKDFMSTALPIQDMSNKAAYKDIPLAIKVKSELSLRRAIELIYACMRQAELEQIPEFDMTVDYVKLVRKELKKIENSKR